VLHDRAMLLMAAGRAAEALERRCEESSASTVTISRDELLQLAEQFQRVTALLTLVHLAEARASQEQAAA
jgi:hypothetical protein